MAESAPKSSAAKRETTHVIVRGYPKIVYLYLTWLASIMCGILAPNQLVSFSEPETREAVAPETPGAESEGEAEAGAPAEQPPRAQQVVSIDTAAVQRISLLGKIWLAIFTFNLLVIAFEFSRIRSVAITFLILALFLAGLHWGFLDIVGAFLGNLQIHMNSGFYYAMALIFSVIFLLVFINSRFNYWEIQPNEILHHHGFMGDVYRYPTRGLRMRKQITDVMEYILLRAGTLVLTPTGVERPIFLENVIGLNKVEDKIQRLLGTLKVRIDEGAIGGTD